MADGAEAEVAPAAAPQEAGPPPATPPPATPPPVPAAVLAGMASSDSLSRVGTPSRERKELWELLNLPEVRPRVLAHAALLFAP